MKKSIKNNMKGFTLVELLAVIVILAIILVIAVPKVMSVIEDAKKATLESTAKMIASAAEKAYIENQTYGFDEEITCESVTNMSKNEYEKCIIEFDTEGNASVSIIGKGSYKGLKVCEGDKNSATASNTSCTISYGNGATYIEKLEAFNASTNGLKKTIATYNDITYDAGIRYVGASPNNKVYFNCKDKDSSNVVYGSTNYDYASSCEVWRMIGVFEVDNGRGKIEKRIKIIRDAFSIGMSWDSSYGGEGIENSVNLGWGINQWGESKYEDGTFYEGADLMRMLNGYYIGEENICLYCNGPNQDTCKNDCSSIVTPLSDISLSMVEDTLWNTYATDYVDVRNLSKMYLGERGITSQFTGKSECESTGGDRCNDEVIRTTKWIGKIGLIYPSDYGYASTDKSCSSFLYGLDSMCKNNNWLHPSTLNYFTILPRSYSTESYVTWNISYQDSLYGNGDASNNLIRPSLYLSSNVKVIGGDGNTTPYKLSL